MKWIISGASGFVGKALSLNLQDINEGVRLIPRDMFANFYQLKEYLESEKPNVIINLAAYGNYHYQSELDKIYEVNLNGFFRLFKASKNVNYDAFIQFGTSSEYGISNLPMSETDKCNPDTFYAASKLAATQLARVLAMKYDKPLVVIRPSSITGKGEQEQHLIPVLIKAALGGTEVKLVPNPSHDFIDIEDLIKAVFLFAVNAYKYRGEIFNVSISLQYTNKQIFNLVEELTDKKIKVKNVRNIRSYDNNNWVVDNTKMFLEGWQPTKDIEQSIKDKIKEYES